MEILPTHQEAPHAQLRQVAHALGAPLCALEVVLGAKAALPPEQGALLEEAVDRLRQILADLQALG